MKCAKCGAELKLGCMYCSICGQEAQIVSDSNLLEDELLRELLQEEKMPSEKNVNMKVSEKKTCEKKKTKKAKKKTAFIWVFAILALVIITIVIGIISHNKHKNSYEWQIQRAEQYTQEKNYVKALEYCKQAQNLKEEDIDVRFRMTDIYLKMEEDASAISILHEIISLDATNETAYEMLIQLYEERNDYDAILKLKGDIRDSTLSDLFSGFEVEKPTFSLEPGTYNDTIQFELEADEDCKIYYTTDGSDPISEGKLYKEAFSMEKQGELEIRAVACDENGIYSTVLKGNFCVEFEKPSMPIAIPDNGTFLDITTVELKGEEGCKIYYTWDNTEPTANSFEYTAPIEIPEGDHILSVILVDKHGMVSDVLKCNYKYLP